jgi:hypothetical protein
VIAGTGMPGWREGWRRRVGGMCSGLPWQRAGVNRPWSSSGIRRPWGRRLSAPVPDAFCGNRDGSTGAGRTGGCGAGRTGGRASRKTRIRWRDGAVESHVPTPGTWGTRGGGRKGGHQEPGTGNRALGTEHRAPRRRERHGGAQPRNKGGVGGVLKIDVLVWILERWRPLGAGASQKRVGRNFNWIWYVGAAVWFLNAALAMYRGSLRMGLTNAAIAAGFLAAGIFFRRLGKRQAGRDGR